VNFKKGNPGCPCDCEDIACEDNCLIPCAEGVPPDDCNFCELNIQLPTPDNTGTDPLLLPPDECPDEAPCFGCYRLFDGRLIFSDSLARGQCDDWEIFWLPSASTTQPFFDTFLRVGLSWLFTHCWTRDNYSCPYESEVPDECPPSNIVIAPISPFTDWTTLFDDMNGHHIRLSGNEWDGECGKLTLKIAYVVLEYGPTFFPDPITEPGQCNDYKWTGYLHTFELPYCSCESVLDPFTFISTESYDSCAGGVDDPCHVDEAVITIGKSDANSNCGTCSCLNCEGYKSTQISVVITGPVINGSFILTSAGGCEFLYNNLNGIGDCADITTLRVDIECQACDDQFKAKFYAGVIGNFSAESEYTDSFGCSGVVTIGELDIFNGSGNSCNLAAHTIQVSFVPT
jgi:hypothetical protein